MRCRSSCLHRRREHYHSPFSTHEYAVPPPSWPRQSTRLLLQPGHYRRDCALIPHPPVGVRPGEAGRALGAAISASVVGALVGAVSLAVSIPIMRPLVLLFGSPELFIIAIMGITFIGTLAGPSLIKGLLAGGIGLMLAAIGRGYAQGPAAPPSWAGCGPRP